MSPSPCIVFRADASPAIGGGHIMRCLTLADALAGRGARCVFLTNPEAAVVAPALARSVHEVVFTRFGESGVPAGFDSRRERPLAVVFDHYGLSAAAESAWRATGARIVAIDDVADRPHDCDLLIDPSHGRTRLDFESLVPPAAEVLIGTDYTLLRTEFAEARPYALERRDGRPVTSLLIATGLSDVGGLSARLAAWVLDARPGLAVSVVIGPSASSRGTLETMAACNPDLTLIVDPPFMAPLMAEADVAIGAIGTTTWERCALGLPSIALVLADNQLANAKTLTDTGAGFVCNGATGGNALIADLADLIASASRRLRMSEAAASLCDGLGASRLADAILGPTSDIDRAVRVRPAAQADAARIWSWRNESAARAMSLHTEPIRWASHREFYARMITDTARHRLMIGDAAGRPFGMVRFDQTDRDIWRVSITLSPAARGLGLGRTLLAEACRAFEAESDLTAVLRAEIKPGNTASLSVFRSNGFEFRTREGEVQIFERVRPSHAPPAGSPPCRHPSRSAAEPSARTIRPS